MADTQKTLKCPPLVVVIMGVSGSGKTTVGALLAGHLHWPVADADDLHSSANIARMHRGLALADADRAPWLRAIAFQIDTWRVARQHGVVTCSALKRKYRDLIIGDRANVRLVYLRGDPRLIARRLVARHGHFMPKSLLKSQLDTLEEPAPGEHAIVVSIGKLPAVLVTEILAALADDAAISAPISNST